ncbi:MAG TPA: PhoPQ-activated protein PqaA family protein, partial [Chryseosolibacter sp.]
MKFFYRIATSLIVTVVSFSGAAAQNTLSPETALQGYLRNGDQTFRWEVKESYEIGNVKGYSLLLTSQQWHEYIWTHQLIILVPREMKYDGALLFITGGSNKKGLPNWTGRDDKFNASLAAVAEKNKGM